VLARDPGASIASEAAHRTPPGSSALRESEASAANVLSVRKRSDSNKAPSRNGNQPLILTKNYTLFINLQQGRNESHKRFKHALLNTPLLK
jgi:hypothetical protein